MAKKIDSLHLDTIKFVRQKFPELIIPESEVTHVSSSGPMCFYILRAISDRGSINLVVMVTPTPRGFFMELYASQDHHSVLPR